MRLLLAFAILITPLPFLAPACTTAPAFAAPAASPTQTLTSTPTPAPVLEQAQREAKLAEDLKTKTEKDLPAKEKELAEAGCNAKQKNSDKCKKLREERDELVKAIDELKKGLAEVKNAKEFKSWIEQLKDLRAKMQALVTAASLVTIRLNTPDENSKLTAVAQLIRAERLHKIMIEPGTYTLRVGVKANGTTKVKKNLFVDAKVRHSAGADLTYQLFDGEGVIAQANSLQCYIEYQCRATCKTS